MLGQDGAATSGEPVTPLAAASLGDAVRPGQGHEHAVAQFLRGSVAAGHALQLAGRGIHSIARRSSDGVHACGDVDAYPSRLASDLREKGGKPEGPGARPAQSHMGKTGMKRQAHHGTADGGDSSVRVERLEPAQDIPGLAETGGRQWR